MTDPVAEINRRVQAQRSRLEPFYREVEKVLVGQKQLLDRLLMGLLTDGHMLLEGVPGLAKTLAVRTVARTLQLDFKRIQFTPDLLPADLVGTQIYNPRTGEFTVKKGPVFANVILADEINRAPAKVQSALLEAMQEKQVTIGETSFPLPQPFLVLATQNPIEQEGTYPLPEAQQDRFMFKVFVKYPGYDEEYRIAETTTAQFNPQVVGVLTGDEIQQLQQMVRRVPVAPFVIHYALRLVRATRIHEGDVPAFVKDWVSWGAGPRGMQYLLLGGKARAMLNGRFFVTTDDIKAVAHPVLRHRIITNFNAESSGISSDKVVDKLLVDVPERRPGDEVVPELKRAFG
jgi:MoxR-like ATPase